MLMPQMPMSGGAQNFQDPMLQYGMGGGMSGSYGAMAAYPWYPQAYSDPRAYHGPTGYPYPPQYPSQAHNWGGIGPINSINNTSEMVHSVDSLAMGGNHGQSVGSQGHGQGQGMAQQGQGMSAQGHGISQTPDLNGRGENATNVNNIPMNSFENGDNQSKSKTPLQEEEDEKKEEVVKKEEVKEEEEEEEKKEETPVKKEETGKKEEITFDWTENLFKNYYPGLLTSSVKFQIFFQILEGCVRIGDRLLVFSQSLFTLSLLEEFLQRSYIPGCYDTWCRNRSYFRLDGSTSAMDREKLINEFNANPSVRLFLVSTRAGSLGINLVGANRVIVFDASFNPCHDTQAVCRVYRYGQRKECFIYRLVTDNSLEKRIYDRQVRESNSSVLILL
ncbi:Helicase ARIP4 [Portunus trituberculatus]|uniref:Helicase ARIP4 n=1 Tax=Portunus trituberculatus TaxID=210409 RepID=A0A5B7H280_PORTR|nr:Helicase ARIP4 [Portunus trituberculatus]